MRRIRAPLLSLPVLAVLALLGSFAWFLHLAIAPQAMPPAAADGIVALTGGAERVATALRLLQGGEGRLLLVSGAGEGTSFATLARLSGADRAEAVSLSRRVTLGHDAATTHGNALETARWVQAHDVHSVLVVTAFYHMPRALAELSAALPAVALYPVPVRPLLSTRQELHLLASEYAKWLALQLGISGDALRPDRLTMRAAAEGGG
jgi:uncharacterized SAM-binding protein YcdF (DUF218 family)